MKGYLISNIIPSHIHIVAAGGSKTQIFTKRRTDLKPWLAVLK